MGLVSARCGDWCARHMAGVNKKRFTQRDWLDLASKVLGIDGPDGLSVDSLCTKANRTKGSFYHHFADHDAFIDALVADWQEKNLDTPIRLSQQGAAHERLRDLNYAASNINLRAEAGIRRLADRHPRVQKVVVGVDKARLRYLETLYRSGGLTAPDAKAAAKIQYAGYLGAQILWPNSFAREVAPLGALVDEMLASHFSSERRKSRKKSGQK